MENSAASRNDVIRGLLTRLEAHVPGERLHAERVAIYSVAVGQKLGLIAPELEMLRYAAQLHDIGKLLLPAVLLTKGEALMADERTLIERHPELARGILEPFTWLAGVMPGIVEHHERFNGTGYPYNLVGSAISLNARIIGVCEAFDAMAYGVYQPARGKDAALLDVQRVAGSDFDPFVVKALTEIAPLINPVIEGRMEPET